MLLGDRDSLFCLLNWTGKGVFSSQELKVKVKLQVSSRVSRNPVCAIQVCAGTARMGAPVAGLSPALGPALPAEDGGEQRRVKSSGGFGCRKAPRKIKTILGKGGLEWR